MMQNAQPAPTTRARRHPSVHRWSTKHRRRAERPTRGHPAGRLLGRDPPLAEKPRANEAKGSPLADRRALSASTGVAKSP